MAVCLVSEKEKRNDEKERGMITLGREESTSECSPAFASCHTVCFKKVYSKLQLLTFSQMI